ncbi:hypothetical protein EC991_011294, partial [Linnemannia zychae]
PSRLPSHIKLSHIKECELSPLEIRTLRELEQLMAPAAEFTNSIGSSKIPTTSLVHTSVRNLLPSINNFNTAIARDVHRALDKHIKNTWSLDLDSPAIDAVLISMYLNPAIFQHTIWNEPNGDSTNRDRAERLITSRIEEIMTKNRKEQGLPERNLREDAFAKLTQYKGEVMDFPEKCSEFICAPHLFWKQLSTMAPEVACTARRYLSMQATSCEAERV